MHIDNCDCSISPSRRRLLKGAIAGGLGIPAAFGLQTGGAALTKEQRDRLTPDAIVAEMKRGNERFRAGKVYPRDHLAMKRSTSTGQNPAAVILGCIDSRTPAEIIIDTGIGDTFNARIAGNVANDDLLGSMEFACAVAGAKVVLVVGHTACGAIKGAIDNVVMGNLTGLLARIKPAVAATQYSGDKSTKNAAYVDAVAKTNVILTVQTIRSRSQILADLEKKGSLKIVGSMYNIESGVLDFVA